MSNYFQIFISLFSILNPILAITIYLDITNGLTRVEKRMVALVCGAAVFILLIGFLFLGQPLMDVMGVHDYSIRLGGGLVVLLIGVLMILKPNDKVEESKNGEPHTNRDIKSLGISPLALPMIVGPAAIVMVLLYGQEEHTMLGKLVVVVVLFLVSVSVVITLMLADFIAKVLGKIGIVVLTKIMGLIIAAIAFEMIVEGLKSVVPILIQAGTIVSS